MTEDKEAPASTTGNIERVVEPGDQELIPDAVYSAASAPAHVRRHPPSYNLVVRSEP